MPEQIYSLRDLYPAKVALAITSNLSVTDFANAVLSNDINALTKIPGIGKKGAERLVLELKDKVTKYAQAPSTTISSKVLLIEEATAALVALGLSKNQATQAINKSLQARPDISDVTLLLQLSLSQKKHV